MNLSMARFTRIEVAQLMEKNGIIPVFYHPDPEVCFEVIKACYLGGLSVFEFTHRGDFAHEVFSEVHKRIISELPEVVLGAGSLIDAASASLYIKMGANFIVSPILNEEMAKACNRRKILWIPGCGTLTEISHAEELGAEIVKIFPAEQIGGAEFVKAVRGPMPWTSLMPTGGVEPERESLAAWFRAGVVCVGIGSKLITQEITLQKSFALLEERVKRVVGILNGIRSTSDQNG